MNSWLDRSERIACCYFSTNSWVDWSERIALWWFRTLQIISMFCSPLIWTRGWFFIAIWGIIIWSNYVSIVERLLKVCTLGLIFHYCNTVCAPFYHLLPCCFLLFLLQKPISTIHITPVAPSLHRTSAPIQFTTILGVLGTKRLFVIWLQGCLRETIFILQLPRIDEP